MPTVASTRLMALSSHTLFIVIALICALLLATCASAADGTTTTTTSPNNGKRNSRIWRRPRRSDGTDVGIGGIDGTTGKAKLPWGDAHQAQLQSELKVRLVELEGEISTFESIMETNAQKREAAKQQKRNKKSNEMYSALNGMRDLGDKNAVEEEREGEQQQTPLVYFNGDRSDKKKSEKPTAASDLDDEAAADEDDGINEDGNYNVYFNPKFDTPTTFLAKLKRARQFLEANIAPSSATTDTPTDGTGITPSAEADGSSSPQPTTPTPPHHHRRQIPRKYNKDEYVRPSDAHSMFVSFEYQGQCRGRVATTRYLSSPMPSTFAWYELPLVEGDGSDEDTASNSGDRRGAKDAINIPEGRLARLANELMPAEALPREAKGYNETVASITNGPRLLLLAADLPTSARTTAVTTPHGIFALDPRYIHIHTPEAAPQTPEEVAKVLASKRGRMAAANEEDEEEGDSHHHGSHHGGSHTTSDDDDSIPLTDAFYIAESGYIDLWVPIGTEYLTLYCDGNTTDPLRVPINAQTADKLPNGSQQPAHSNGNEHNQQHNDQQQYQQGRTMHTADDSGNEYREIHVVGPPSKVWNLVFIAGAYPESDRESFFENVKQIYEMMRDDEMDNKYSGGAVLDSIHDMHASVPHNRYLPFWNVFAVFQPSQDVGPSRPKVGYTNENNLRCVHPPEIERAISCDWMLARALAAVAPVNMYGDPGRSLVITLVNTPIYGGTGQHIFGNRNFGNFFNGYDLSVDNQRERMLSLLNHEIGHAMGGLADEYLATTSNNYDDFIYANCQMGSGSSPPNNPRWKFWIDELILDPMNFISKYADRVRSGSWTMLQYPLQECLYNNYYRPTDYCMMNRLNNYAMCPICREGCTVTEMRIGFELQFPRKPMEDQIVIVLTDTSNSSILNVNSNYTVHFSRYLTAANHFRVTMKDIDGTTIAPTEGQEAEDCPACFILRAANFAKYPLNEVVRLEVHINDHTLFVQDPLQKAAVTRDQPDQFDQKAYVRIMVTDKDPSTFGYAETTAPAPTANPAARSEFAPQADPTPIVNVSFIEGVYASEVGTSVYDLTSYYAMCSPENSTTGEGLCFLQLRNNVYERPANLDGKLSEYDVWAVCLVAGLAVLFLIGWMYQCVRNRDVEKGVLRPIFRVEFGCFVQMVRFLMMLTAVCLMFASVGALALGAYYYTKLSVLGKLMIFVGIGVAVPLYIFAFVGFVAVVSRSKRMLVVNGVILFIALGIVVALIILGKSFIDGIGEYNNSYNEWVTDLWMAMLDNDPGQICAIQNELHCTGWNQSCLAVFGVADECPRDCDVINNKYPLACRAFIQDIVESYGPTAMAVLYGGCAMLVIGIGFDIIAFIGLYWMKLTLRKRNKRAIRAVAKRNSSNNTAMEKQDEKKYGALLLLMSLSSNDADRLRREFRRIDRNGSGTLDKLELLLFMKKALCYKPTEAEINEIFAIADADNDGTINLKEFMSLFGSAGAASGKYKNDRATAIVRARLIERGLLQQVEMARVEAVKANIAADKWSDDTNNKNNNSKNGTTAAPSVVVNTRDEKNRSPRPVSNDSIFSDFTSAGVRTPQGHVGGGVGGQQHPAGRTPTTAPLVPIQHQQHQQHYQQQYSPTGSSHHGGHRQQQGRLDQPILPENDFSQFL